MAPLERFRRIAATLNVRKRTTAALLATELEVSVQTVYRHIDFMRDRLALPIQADHEGYFFDQEVKLCSSCARRVRV